MKKKSIICWLLCCMTSMITMILYVMGYKYFCKELTED